MTALPALPVPAQSGTGPLPARPLLPEAVQLYRWFAGLGAAALTMAQSSTVLAAVFRAQGAVGGLDAGGLAIGTGPAVGLAVLIAGWGAYLLVWSLRSLRVGRDALVPVMRRLLPLAATIQLGALLAGLWRLPASSRTFDATGACTLLVELSMLASLGWSGRRHTPSPAEAGPPPAGRLLMGMFAAALLVAGVTTPGLAASAAGQSAVPHGEHGQHQPSGSPADGNPVPSENSLHDPAAHSHSH
ncbi:MAG: hypothetical protein JWO93_429 [Micrococcaceae bacterium]|nr:hypothetical protein [Micrococcaceae bacterium]